MEKSNRQSDSLADMPNLEESEVGPVSEPLPIRERFLRDLDWWKCYRLGGVSGRYNGEMTTPWTGRYFLDLRVDIDPRYRNSPIMNKISGDLHEIYRFMSGGKGRKWQVYRESWIVDEPKIKWNRCNVRIVGNVRFWKGIHPKTSIEINIPWGTFTPAGPAEVSFYVAGVRKGAFSCDKRSDCFRNLTLEVDVCQSVNNEPILPSYDTHAHLTRPVDLPQRILTIEEAYRETGIDVTIRPDRTIIDDNASEFSTWSVAELHDAMETHFSQYAGGWPKWQMWGLLAGAFDDPGTAGIMFDASAAYGGAGEPPDRQGFAVFRNHSWFANLPTSDPPWSSTEAEAMRDYLYTYVHEAGHAFNFLHSWNKGRPDALSWMNYPYRYDWRNGANSYWSNFRFRFDDEELIHIRHGDRSSVITGGDPWASGGHLEAPLEAMSQLEGEPPIEFLVRSKENFEYMEPVVLEFRLRNLIDDISVDMDTNLKPEWGGVVVHIRRPDGRILQYAPILCMIGIPKIRTLKPPKEAIKGEDRYSENIFLSYGKYGFYFDEPGEYLVRATYQGTGEILIPSNIHKVRVGYPLSKEEEQTGRQFFTYQVGMNLYLGGSRSPHLSKGIQVLESIAEQYKDTFLGAKVATTLASSLAKPFFSYNITKGIIELIQSADPKKALDLTSPARALYERVAKKAQNIEYHQLIRERTKYFVSLGQKEEAKEEITTLLRDLKARGVNEPILNEIKEYQESI